MNERGDLMLVVPLNKLRKLYSIYSPLKTNKSLSNIYSSLFKDNSDVPDIRLKVNNLIYHNYLNEAVIKSAFINEHLIKKSPRKNITIFELNACGARADLSVMNGKSYVYEIKTEFDTFERLDKQTENYLKFFDYLNVIVPIDRVEQVKELLANNIGIISYYQNRLNNIKFKIERSATINTNKDPYAQLSSLTKRDLLKLIDKSNEYSINTEDIINQLLENKTVKEIDTIYREYMKQKYYDKWNFLHENINDIYLLDYQWFFKNNIDTEIVYK